VTHPDIERYFMTMEEAAQLVMQAGAFTEGGNVFILDMGEPVRIIDLANPMVRLLARGKNIEIRVTGLRPGDKLHETLVFQVEETLPTPHPKINRVVHDYGLPQDFKEQVEGLIEPRSVSTILRHLPEKFREESPPLRAPSPAC